MGTQKFVSIGIGLVIIAGGQLVIAAIEDRPGRIIQTSDQPWSEDHAQDGRKI
jgi:hypothetical protein